MASGRVWTCIEWDSGTETCTVEGWADPPSLWWSPYTLEDAGTFVFAIGMCWAIGWGFRQVRRALDT